MSQRRRRVLIIGVAIFLHGGSSGFGLWGWLRHGLLGCLGRPRFLGWLRSLLAPSWLRFGSLAIVAPFLAGSPKHRASENLLPVLSSIRALWDEVVFFCELLQIDPMVAL